MDTPEVKAADGDKTLKLVNVGASLRVARERAGLSVADIANRIKFAARQVEALEANDFAHLPKATFLRGFVRSYARALQIDETGLIANLPGDPVQQQVVVKPQAAEVSFPTALSLQRINLTWLIGSLGVALLLALFLMTNDAGNNAETPQAIVEPLALPTTQDAASGVAATVVEPVATVATVENQETAKPAVTVKPPLPAIAAKPELIAPQSVQAKPVAPARIAQPAMPQADAIPATTAAVKPELPLEMLKRRPMHLVFHGESSVEVKDVNGALLLSRDNLTNIEKWIGGPGRAPYSVILSHPENVRLFYKGRQIDLSAYAGKGSARFKVD